MREISIASALTAAAMIGGLGFVAHLPCPSAIAAAPEFVSADAEAREKDRSFYEKQITAIRLREIGFERSRE
jgi:hypothetical protein